MESGSCSWPKVAAMILAGAVAALAGEPGTPPDVTAYMRCEVVALPGTVARGKQIAKQILGSIGVNMAWAADASIPNPGVLMKIELEPGPEDGETLGETTPFASGHLIRVNYGAVRRSAGISRQLEPIILGHVLVHEITHVLQGVDRHSEKGMMKARWTPEDYCEMEWKPLEFTPEDIILIRLGLDVLRGHDPALASR